VQQGSHSAIFLALQSDFFMVNFIIFVRVITSRRMRWTGHVARMEEGRDYTGFCWGNLRDRDHLEDPGIDGRILRGIFRKWDVGY